MDGSVDNSCDINTGKCTCKPNVSGDKCDESTEGYFGFPGEPEGIYNNLCIGKIVSLYDIQTKSFKFQNVTAMRMVLSVLLVMKLLDNVPVMNISLVTNVTNQLKNILAFPHHNVCKGFLLFYSLVCTFLY